MWLVLLAVLLATPRAADAPPGDDLVGGLEAHLVRPGESLVELARQYGVGFNEIAAANPRLDPFVPAAGATAVIPTAWILPVASSPGAIVVNLSEMRLYFFPAAGAPLTFPVGVATAPGATPLGPLKVIEKAVAPTWYPTAAIRREDPNLPAAVPPGPENPLGSHALRLSAQRPILIHGTNKPFGVGRKVSHGCLRLYPEDIRRLFRLVEIGTPVVIVREPVKVGLRQDRIYVEVHDDETVAADALDEALRLLRARAVLHRVDPRKLAAAVRAKTGVPVHVTANLPGDLVGAR